MEVIASVVGCYMFIYARWSIAVLFGADAKVLPVQLSWHADIDKMRRSASCFGCVSFFSACKMDFVEVWLGGVVLRHVPVEI